MIISHRRMHILVLNYVIENIRDRDGALRSLKYYLLVCVCFFEMYLRPRVRDADLKLSN